MQKLTTKDKFRSCGNVFCICGHEIFKHQKDGCSKYVDGTECEDRWRCPCQCKKCIKTNKKIMELLAEQIDVDNY